MTKELKQIKSVKLSTELINKITKKANKEKRTAHYLMVEALEKAFKNV
jgi:predicted transcriptional regulator